MDTFRIGSLADRTGASPPTIRYYESIGLLPEAVRPTGSQRSYTAADVKRLTFIRRCREFGFSIDQVRALVAIMEDDQRCCTDARELAMEHLQEVRTKLNELTLLEHAMSEFIERCDNVCVGGPGTECVVLNDLSRS